MINKKSIFYSLLDAPIGKIGIAITEKKIRLIKINTCTSDFIELIKHKYQVQPFPNEKYFIDAKTQLNEYFKGERLSFKLNMEIQGSEFDNSVWNIVRQIRYGEILSYGQIAKKLLKDKAARAVGNAVGRNPLPIIIPCHRVVGIKSIGGFSSGIDIKRQLLKIEGLKIY